MWDFTASTTSNGSYTEGTLAVDLAATGTTDWTMGAWINPDTAGVSNIGNIISTNSGAFIQRQWIKFAASGTGRIEVTQSYQVASASAFAVTNSILLATKRQCLIGTHRASDKKTRIYIGSEDTPMAEASYVSQTAGSGIILTGATKINVGCFAANARNQGFDGRIGRAFVLSREITLGQMEAFRLGRIGQFFDTSLQAFFPLVNSATQELSGKVTSITTSTSTQSSEEVQSVLRYA